MKKSDEVAGLTDEQAEFWAMSNEDKRVAIASDVLRYLDAKKIEAETLVYLRFPRNGNLTKAGRIRVDKSADLALSEAAKCQVCALGACLYALVLRADQLTLGELGASKSDNLLHVGNCYTKNILEELFAHEQLRDMEAAFEKWRRYSSMEGTSDQRLRTIMKNIIRNKGTFKL